MNLRAILPTFSAALALALGALSSSEAQPAVLDLATYPQSRVEIGTGPRRQHFDVWIADNAERQTQGLMFVRDLPEGRGMLFTEREARPTAFWMKNTYIALDMLFIGTDHRVVKIAASTPPLSLATIPSDAPVIAVLEIKGGEAARRGIRAGDPVSWP